MKRGFYYQYVGCKSLMNNVTGKARKDCPSEEILAGEKHPGTVKTEKVSIQPAKKFYSTRSS
jgi:hypothetical protein